MRRFTAEGMVRGVKGLLIGVVFTVGLSDAGAFWFSDPEERVLVVGVPSQFQPYLAKFLIQEDIPYRLDSKTRTFYVVADPIPILEKAQGIRPIEGIARRGLLERRLEKELRRRWPKVEDPRVCLAFPDYIHDKEPDAEPIAFILVRGLSRAAGEEAKQLVAGAVTGLPLKNIAVVGTDWRPGPGYGAGGENRTRVARRD